MQEDKNVKKKGFLKGMRAELKKVIWPTGKQTAKSTFVTISFVLLISAVLIVLNLAFDGLNGLWINSLPTNKSVINIPVSGEMVSGEVSGEVVSGENL